MSQQSTAVASSPSTQESTYPVEKMIDVLHRLHHHLLLHEYVLKSENGTSSEGIARCRKAPSADRNRLPSNPKSHHEFQKAKRHLEAISLALSQLKLRGWDVDGLHMPLKIRGGLSSVNLNVDDLRQRVLSERENHRSLMRRLSEEMIRIILDEQLPSKSDLQILVKLRSKKLILEKEVELENLKRLSPKGMIQEIFDKLSRLEGGEDFEQLSHHTMTLDIFEQILSFKDSNILEQLLSQKSILVDLENLDQRSSKKLEDLQQLSSIKMMLEDLYKLEQLSSKYTNKKDPLPPSRALEDLYEPEQLSSKYRNEKDRLPPSLEKLLLEDLGKMKVQVQDLNFLEQLSSKRMTWEGLVQLSSKNMLPADLRKRMLEGLTKIIDEFVNLEQVAPAKLILEYPGQLSPNKQILKQQLSFLYQMYSFLDKMETVISQPIPIPDTTEKILEEIKLLNGTLEPCFTSLMRIFSCDAQELDTDEAFSEELDTNEASDAYFLVRREPKEDIKKKIRDCLCEDFVRDFKNLDTKTKLCLLCFSALPGDAVVKKRALLHWWIGEGFIGSHAEANVVLLNLLAKGFIQPNLTKQKVVGFKMDRLIRPGVVKMAEKLRFLSFDPMGAPEVDFSWSHRACLVQKGNESTLQRLMERDDPEKLHTIFNVNDPYPEFKRSWFPKLKNLNVLCLGAWQGSDRSYVEVQSTEFLTDLKIMKCLKVLSLQSISRIVELPDSVCALSSLLILDLKACHNLGALPRSLKALKNLTHLDLSECHVLDRIPKGLGSLKELQVLKGFVVSDSGSKNQCRLAELVELKKLRKLSVNTDWGDFPTEEDLHALQSFKVLENLSLTWRKTSEGKATGMGANRKDEDQGRSRNQPSEQTKKLQKLELLGFPGRELPEWLTRGKLEPEKKLYIIGGDLQSLYKGGNGVNKWSVKILRLKFLKGLKMDWRELRNSFEELVYLEKVQCPKLTLFPCDEDGLWLNLPPHKKLEELGLGLTWSFLQRSTGKLKMSPLPKKTKRVENASIQKKIFRTQNGK